MANRPACQRTLDFILANPDLHDQRLFSRETHCGTTGCVAGTAVFIETGQAAYMRHNRVNYNRVGEYLSSHGRDAWHTDDEAAELLGLDDLTAKYLFFRTVSPYLFTNDPAVTAEALAVELLTRLADGRLDRICHADVVDAAAAVSERLAKEEEIAATEALILAELDAAIAAADAALAESAEDVTAPVVAD